jgi:hypothetical protein
MSESIYRPVFAEASGCICRSAVGCTAFRPTNGRSCGDCDGQVDNRTTAAIAMGLFSTAIAVSIISITALRQHLIAGLGERECRAGCHAQKWFRFYPNPPPHCRLPPLHRHHGRGCRTYCAASGLIVVVPSCAG